MIKKHTKTIKFNMKIIKAFWKHVSEWNFKHAIYWPRKQMNDHAVRRATMLDW
jgi:hypothetical protein